MSEMTCGSAFRTPRLDSPTIDDSNLGLRPLTFSDRDDLRDLLVGLEPSARWERFGAIVNDQMLAAHALRAVTDATAAIGAVAAGRLRGAVEIYRKDDDVAEAALVVDAAWRNRGLGAVMLDGALQWAANAGTRRLRLIFSRHNWPMRRLVGRANARFDLVLDAICADIAAAGVTDEPLGWQQPWSEAAQ